MKSTSKESWLFCMRIIYIILNTPSKGVVFELRQLVVGKYSYLFVKPKISFDLCSTTGRSLWKPISRILWIMKNCAQVTRAWTVCRGSKGRTENRDRTVKPAYRAAARTAHHHVLLPATEMSPPKFAQLFDDSITVCNDYSRTQ